MAQYASIDTYYSVNFGRFAKWQYPAKHVTLSLALFWYELALSQADLELMKTALAAIAWLAIWTS